MSTAQVAVAHTAEIIGRARIIQADCFDWLARQPRGSIHAIVTDPPYGVKEYEHAQLEKRASGYGGIWRVPPSFDGNVRAPLPRFTALNERDRHVLRDFFLEWSQRAVRVLRPGGHVFIASNSFLSQLVFSALVDGGLEFRGVLVRLVRTLRGGNRPKNGETEFPHVATMLRGCYEPWGVLRKPLPDGMTVSDCLREFQTGGLRRQPNGNPFCDVLSSQRTPQRERKIAPHPSLKPQSFLRKVVYASLPLGVGVIVDPFMGAGSTIAAAEAMGLDSIGIERHAEYYEVSRTAIPRLAALTIEDDQLPLL